ncbi:MULTISPECIES: cellulose biosynthesis protein BcsQ [Pseudomonas]|uniref:Cellulose synthase operon protein YhjQ n=1 Tax=Pseudomonas azadiae TaxID=2843612 RepID=A0ABS6P072_9PSED|nr:MULTISPECIES: cellulose biosynthesis protein BcsQ [Pseudomonas]MBV4453846.1 cellulose synthase operon protein YhjQ [Pseudomonas azadiae]NMF41854.1 cellulose synthase operon protein YhjQ [Pseudomonas sp. SWRI 103]
MSLTDELLALFGKRVTRDACGLDARLHFFGSIPVNDGAVIPSPGADTDEQSQPVGGGATRAKVVALVSVNGGVGRSSLVTALSSGMQRQGESVLALDLDPQNALCHHLGLDSSVPGIGCASLQNTQWAQCRQAGFAGAQVIPFGDTDTQQQETLQGWLKREPDWLAQQLAGLRLGEHQTVIIDTPAGNNVYFHQALNLADGVLVIARADAASLATLDQLDSLLAPYLERERAPAVQFVINHLDENNAIQLDMVEAFKQRLGTVPLQVHGDTAISEAQACAADPLDVRTVSLAVDDIHDLSRVVKALGKRFQGAV